MFVGWLVIEKEQAFSAKKKKPESNFPPQSWRRTPSWGDRWESHCFWRTSAVDRWGIPKERWIQPAKTHGAVLLFFFVLVFNIFCYFLWSVGKHTILMKTIYFLGEKGGGVNILKKKKKNSIAHFDSWSTRAIKSIIQVPRGFNEGYTVPHNGGTLPFRIAANTCSCSGVISTRPLIPFCKSISEQWMVRSSALYLFFSKIESKIINIYYKQLHTLTIDHQKNKHQLKFFCFFTAIFPAAGLQSMETNSFDASWQSHPEVTPTEPFYFCVWLSSSYTFYLFHVLASNRTIPPLLKGKKEGHIGQKHQLSVCVFPLIKIKAPKNKLEQIPTRKKLQAKFWFLLFLRWENRKLKKQNSKPVVLTSCRLLERFVRLFFLNWRTKLGWREEWPIEF